MNLKIHKVKDSSIAELVADNNAINNVQDAVDLIGNASYLGAHKVVIYKNQLNPDFFELKTQLAGEILQKFSNYRVKLAIIGDFTKITRKSLRDFIKESNKNKHILFIASLEEALLKL